MTETSAEQTYDAFVSHASVDRARAEELVALLESRGLRCWFAPRDVRPGREYGDEILSGIERSRCFVLLLSGAANLSGMVLREVERAAAKEKPIYPVRLEEVAPSRKLEFFISMHQWIDAWDALAELHAERLAAALNTGEEWVGNEWIRRRRGRRLSFAAVTAIAVAAIIGALVFSEDLRRVAQSPEQRARSDLAAIGVPWTDQGLAAALARGDLDQLRLFEKGGMALSDFERALASLIGDDRTSAKGLFESGRTNRMVNAWFAGLLQQGLPADLLLPRGDKGVTTLFWAALDTKNVDAAVALLESGASPHPYESFEGSRSPVPRWLYPLAYIDRHAALAPPDEKRLIAALLEADVTVPERGHARRFMSHRLHGVDRTTELLDRTLPEGLDATPRLCEAVPARCEIASAATGKDWCGLLGALPARLVQLNSDHHRFRGNIALDYLLTIFGDKAFILGRLEDWRNDYPDEHIIIEVSPERGDWRIHTIQEDIGCGIISGSSYYWCWVSFSFREHQNESPFLGSTGGWTIAYDADRACRAMGERD
ncbi:MAG: toll/interleukin-1 receptor domain-containing protein [Ectothiorhodospiraceae bacterium]|nr:toll/interleukin-1 receptor domain-containing protein [Ectothiorhodospiraceae bacterium]